MSDKQKTKDKDKKRKDKDGGKDAEKDAKKRRKETVIDDSSNSSVKAKKKKEKKNKKEKVEKGSKENGVNEKSDKKTQEVNSTAQKADSAEKPLVKLEDVQPFKPDKTLKAWQDDTLEIDSDEEDNNVTIQSSRLRTLSGVAAQSSHPTFPNMQVGGSSSASASAPTASAVSGTTSKHDGQAPLAGQGSADEEVDPLDAFMADLAKATQAAQKPDSAAATPGMGVMDASRVKSITLDEVHALMNLGQKDDAVVEGVEASDPAAPTALTSRGPESAVDLDDDDDDRFHSAFLAEMRKLRGDDAGTEKAMASGSPASHPGLCSPAASSPVVNATASVGASPVAASPTEGSVKPASACSDEDIDSDDAESSEEEAPVAEDEKVVSTEPNDLQTPVPDGEVSAQPCPLAVTPASDVGSVGVASTGEVPPQTTSQAGDKPAEKVVLSKKEKRKRRREAKELEKKTNVAAAKRKALDGFGTKGEQLMENDAERSEESSAEEQESYFDLVKRFTTKKSLTAVDHASVVYPPFRKNLYVQVKEITNMKDHEVEALRKSHGDIRVRGKTCPRPIKTFLQCGMPEKIIKILDRRDYEKPFPIQMQAIPALMCGRDIIGVAQTGSGKTLAYLLPAFRHVLDQPPLQDGDGPIVFIVAPTRELALQIQREANVFCKAVNISSVCAYGGGPMGEQLSALRKGAEVLVGTPGRLIDVLTISCGKVTNLRRVTFMVLDEADRMFDMGFEPQIGMFLQTTRPDKQVALFSATLPSHVEALCRTVLKRPLEIVVGERNTAATNVTQYVEVLEETQKFYRLLQLLGEWNDYGSIIIFVHQQKDVDEMFTELLKFGYPSLPLHGGQDQQDRDFTLQDFKDGVTNILIATSVAARGIDVKSVVLVVNFRVPEHYEDYIHRIGRTGRAGKPGFAFTFIQPDEGEHAQDMVDALRQCGQDIPLKLKTLAEDFQAQVNTGQAKKKRRWTGFSGKGFKFDSTEKSQQQKDRLKAKVDAMIGDNRDDEKFNDPWDEDKPLSKAAQDRKAKEEQQRSQPKSSTAPTPSSTVAAAAAVAARMQSENAKQSGTEPAIPGVGSTPADFIPAAAFQGSRPGMSFKMGPKGIGYYTDSNPKPPPKAEEVKQEPAALEFQASSTFTGAREGMIFTRGPEGLGYYEDLVAKAAKGRSSIGGASAAPGEFVKATSWQGSKPGKVFKLGDKGLGYYSDAGPGHVFDRAPSGSPEQCSSPASPISGSNASPPPPRPPVVAQAARGVSGRSEQELDDQAQFMAEQTLQSLLEGENGEQVREKQLPALKAKLKEKLRKAQPSLSVVAAPPPPPSKFEGENDEPEPLLKALPLVPGIFGGAGNDQTMVVRSIESMQASANRTIKANQENAQEVALMLASGNTMRGMGNFQEEFEINDYPQIARQRISHREPLTVIEELTGAKCWVKGQYFADERKMPEGGRKLYVEINGPTSTSVQKAKNEVRRMMEALAIRTLNIPGMNRTAHGTPGRYDPATGK